MNIPNVNAVQEQTQMAESMVSRNALLAEESIRLVHSAFEVLALSGLLQSTTLHHHALSTMSRVSGIIVWFVVVLAMQTA